MGVAGQTFTPNTLITPSSIIYFAWNYSVTSGSITTNAQALGIDDISISANAGVPTLTATPNSLTLGAIAGQSATGSYTLSGSNLGAGASVSVSSGSASVLVSTGGAYAQTLTLAADANGSLSQVVSVQYTAPTTGGTSTVTIANTSGSQSAPVAVSTTATATPTYVWTGATSTSWSEPGNWLPNRTTPGVADILKFDGGTVTVAVDFSSSQTIGQLLLVNGVQATFSTDGNRTLTIDNNLPGDDFVVGSGASFTVTNSGAPVPAATAALIIALTSPETGNVAGTVVFSGNTGVSTGRHALQAAGTNAVQFVAGSLFQQAATYDGSTPFGGTANSVIFRNGARYEQYGGGNPFALLPPASVTTFEPGSYYLFALPSGSPSLNGRTVGNLEFASAANVNVTGGDMLTIQGNLLVTKGIVNLGLTGGATLLGNVTVNGTAVLNFLPMSAATITLAGSATQTLGGNSTAASPINFGSSTNLGSTLHINNASGVALGITTSVYGPLQLSSGLLMPSTVNTLVLTPSATVMGGSATSYVSGPVRRLVAAGGSGSFTFPVGKGLNYRPLTLNVAAQSSATIYQAEQLDQDAGTSVTSPLQRVSRNRYFTVTPYSASTPTQVQQPTGFSGTITLSFGYDDKVSNPATLVVAKRPDGSQPWGSIGYGTNSTTGTSTGPAGTYASGTVTSGTFTSFSDFTLGSTSADLTTNPLPVQLARFSAQRAAAGVVALTWTTASELNSARFDVERSLDGLVFAPVATVAAQGNSAQAHDYAARDALAPASPLYYRLKLIDADGTSTYSPTVAVAGGASLAAYPNPTTGELTLPGAAGQPVSLLDALGRPVRQLTLGASERLDMSGLPAGLYLLRVPNQPAQRITKQ